jgi:capsular exopolysaccharide synthesis family protein
MELKDLSKLMWRNAIYIILGLILGAGLGSIVSKYQTPVYEASTKIFVSRTRQQSNSDMLSLSDDQLLAINIQMAKSQPVLDDVTSQLGSKIDADNIQVESIPNTLILQIKVQDHDPQRAVSITNLLVKILIQQNETLLTSRYLEIENGLNQQLDQVQKQIDDLQVRITQTKTTGVQEQLALVKQQIEELKNESADLEKEIANYPHNYPTPLQVILLAEKQVRLEQVYSMLTLYQQIQTNLTYTGKPGQDSPNLENPQLTVLQSALDVYKQINITLINNREGIRLARTQSRQNVTQIVSVAVPKIPVRPMPLIYLLLGGAVGLVLTAIAILIIAQLDDSLKSAGQIEELLGLPVLGSVFDYRHNKDRLITTFGPDSKEVDAMRALGTNLEVGGIKKNIRTLLIVNAEPTNTRTNVAANLAIVNAQLGKQVILLDGDLKHPHLHSLFGLENEKGFAELLNGKIDLKNACHAVPDVERMDLIPSGSAEKDETGWLTSEKLTQLLSTLKKHADLVIVDCPTTDTADAQILATRMDAVLLAIRVGHTQVDAAQAVLKRFQLIGARLTGTVIYRTIQYRLNIPLQIKPVKNEKTAEIKSEIESSAISLP